MKTRFLFIFIFILKVFLSSGQDLTNFNQIVKQKIEPTKTFKTPITSGLLFKFYKNFISSQDGSNCSFYPSCSQYANECIKHKGLFIGTLFAFDRISRCNGGNHPFYTSKYNKLYDPFKYH